MSPPPTAQRQGICQIRETLEEAATIGGFFTIWGLGDLEQSPGQETTNEEVGGKGELAHQVALDNYTQ